MRILAAASFASAAVLAFVSYGAASSVSARPGPAAPEFNRYVLEAVAILDRDRKLGGYDIKKRFTRDLRYGGDCCLRASRPLANNRPNPTMCVAAVVEVMVEALNRYQTATGDLSFKSRLPLSRWSSGAKTGVIPNVFMYAGSDSAGTGHSLKRLGLGDERPFDRLKAGDFINFNRTNRTGHAVVFMGFLKRGATEPAAGFSADVVGFRYFSAQGMGRADGGFGYRNAYFLNKCPVPRGRNDDCNIIGLTVRPNGTVQQSRRLFNTGTMHAPGAWRTAEALAELKAATTRSFEEEGLTRGAGLEEAVEAELGRELAPDESRYIDGSGGV